MGRPKVEDKLKQIPVGVRKSVIDKYGIKAIQKEIKQFIQKFN